MSTGSRLPKPPDTDHFTRKAALRARRRWLASLRGRDAYVHRGGKRRWYVSYIDYEPPRRDPEQQSLKDAHSHGENLRLVLGRLSLYPADGDYATAINLAAQLTASLTAADHHRRFAEAEGIRRPQNLTAAKRVA